MYIFGILSFVPTDRLGGSQSSYHAIAIPILDEEYILEKEREIRGSRERGVMWYYIKLSQIKLAISGPLFSHLRKRGLHISLWNINSEETLNKAMEFYPNIDCLGTDSPANMVK